MVHSYGARLNMMPDGFNSILIDRGDRVSIQGDGHPTMAAALSAFGSAETYDLVHEMLVKTDSGCANHSQCNVVDSGLMTYPIYWCSSVNDWYWASGDTAKFLALAPDMARIIDHAVATFLQPGLPVAFFGWDDRIANGFCGSCNLEVQLGFAALVIRACGDFAATLRHAGDAGNATRYAGTAQRLAARLRARPSSGGGAWHEDYGVHAAAYAINARVLATGAEVGVLVKRELSDPVTVCSWSPFNNYWILQALGNAGKMDQAAAFVKLCWAPMLKLGKGCFWELFSPEWAAWMEDGDKAPTSPSYCHPWASGVTHWLTGAMAGVRPLLPGYARFVATPHLSGRYGRVHATVPTPHGPITVSATRHASGGQRAGRAGAAGAAGAAVAVEVAVQSSRPGLVGLRLADEATGCRLNLTSVRAAGAAAAVLSAGDAAAEVGAVLHQEHGAHVYVEVAAGATVVTAAFLRGCGGSGGGAPPAQERPPARPRQGLPTIPPFGPATYPASWTTDTTSGGDWIGKFGKSGYSLLAFDASGKSVTSLPGWVLGLYAGAKSNNEAGVKSKHVGTDAGNKAFLADPRPAGRGTGARGLGWTTNSGNYYGADGSQGTVLNVNTTRGHRYTVTLYMVSGVRPAGGARAPACASSGMVSSPCSATKQAIRVMDLETLNPVAAEPLLSEFPGGLFWSLTYDRGVRLRIMPVDGDSGFSAVFFDEAR